MNEMKNQKKMAHFPWKSYALILVLSLVIVACLALASGLLVIFSSAYFSQGIERNPLGFPMAGIIFPDISIGGTIGMLSIVLAVLSFWPLFILLVFLLVHGWAISLAIARVQRWFKENPDFKIRLVEICILPVALVGLCAALFPLSVGIGFSSLSIAIIIIPISLRYIIALEEDNKYNRRVVKILRRNF